MLYDGAKRKAVTVLALEPQQLHRETGGLSTEQQESVPVRKRERRVLPEGKMPPKRRSVKASYVAPTFSAMQIGHHREI